MVVYICNLFERVTRGGSEQRRSLAQCGRLRLNQLSWSC